MLADGGRRGDTRGMRIVAVVVVLLGACVDRTPGDGSTGTGTSASSTGNAADPSNPMEDPTTDGLDTVAGVCKPVAASCPADYVCCSDDPATTLGRLPNYFNGQIDGTYGVPIFSGANNALSYSGQCVDVGGFPSPFTTGCPVPCNPTWAPAQVAEFCGPEATCCPFRALDPIKDCVLDSNTNLWRAVRGSDIPMLTTWGDKHTTNQDPQGTSCTLFASGGGGPVDAAALADCYAQLNVADQRGFCSATCPCYEDLCDQKNPGWVPRCG